MPTRRLAMPHTLLALACFALAMALPAQQWVLRSDPGSTALVASEWPLPPLFLGSTASPLGLAVGAFRGTEFHRRTEVLPPEWGVPRAAAYDPIHHRIVVYAAQVPFVSGTATSSLCVFDGARWSVLPTSGPQPQPRIGSVFTFDPQRGTLLLFGGRGNLGASDVLGDTWELAGSTWTQLGGSGPGPRFDAAIARAAAAGPLVLFGGAINTGTALGDTWTWDGTTWTQRTPTTVPPARLLHAMAHDPLTGRATMVGGRSALSGGLSSVRADVWSWTGSDWQQEAAPPNAQLVQVRLTIEQGDLLLIGRSPKLVFGQVVDDDSTAVHVQRRNVNGWTSLFASVAAPAVSQAAATFDSVRQEIVQFGGRTDVGNTYVDVTATWSNGWTIQATTSAPSPRARAAIAFDPVRGEAVLFGGTNGSSHFGDTWVWNGTNWQQRTPPNAPAARKAAAMAWDPTRNAVVLWGGNTATTSYQDTWTWDGTNWTSLATTPSPPLAVGQLVFDPSRQTMALYLDRGSLAPSELWDLTASGWAQTNTTAPGIGHLVYDPDPAVGSLALLCSTDSFNFVGNSWVSRGGQRMNGYRLVTDSQLDAVIAVGAWMSRSTSTPAGAATYGVGCGPLGEVTCAFDRAAALGADVVADIRTLEPNGLTALFFGSTQANAPIGGGCTVYADSLIVVVPALAGPHSFASVGLTIPNAPILNGVELFAQAVTVHAAGLGFSNGARLRVGW